MDGGVWLEPDCEDRLAADATGRWGDGGGHGLRAGRLTRSATLSASPRPPWRPGIDLARRAADPDRTVARRAHRRRGQLGAHRNPRDAGGAQGPAPRRRGGHSVDAGDPLATAENRVWIQVRRPGTGDDAAVCAAGYAAGRLARERSRTATGPARRAGSGR